MFFVLLLITLACLIGARDRAGAKRTTHPNPTATLGQSAELAVEKCRPITQE